MFDAENSMKDSKFLRVGLVGCLLVALAGMGWAAGSPRPGLRATTW
jgi:hypothetical protein